MVWLHCFCLLFCSAKCVNKKSYCLYGCDIIFINYDIKLKSLKVITVSIIMIIITISVINSIIMYLVLLCPSLFASSYLHYLFTLLRVRYHVFLSYFKIKQIKKGSILHAH